MTNHLTAAEVFRQNNGDFGRPQDRVLHTLTRFPGQLVEEWVPGRNGAWASRLVRAFRLPDAVEAQAA